jgi:excisionase family DNA binding protein
LDSSVVDDKKFYSTRDLEERWGVSRWTIQRIVKDGRLKPSRIRGSVRFSAATVMTYERKA